MSKTDNGSPANADTLTSDVQRLIDRRMDYLFQKERPHGCANAGKHRCLLRNAMKRLQQIFAADKHSNNNPNQ